MMGRGNGGDEPKGWQGVNFNDGMFRQKMDWNGISLRSISLRTFGKSEGTVVSWPRKKDDLTVFCRSAEVSAGGCTSCRWSHLGHCVNIQLATHVVFGACGIC